MKLFYAEAFWAIFVLVAVRIVAQGATLPTPSNRLLHPCYSSNIPVYEAEGSDQAEISFSETQFNVFLRMEFCEARSRAETYISRAVLETCLNLFFNRTLYRRQPLDLQNRKRIYSCRDFRAIMRYDMRLFRVNMTPRESLQQSYLNNTVLAILFLDDEINRENDIIFENILKNLRYKLYDILCLLQYTVTAISEEEIENQRNIRDNILNGIMSNSRSYEKSLFIVSAIRKMLQKYFECRY